MTAVSEQAPESEASAASAAIESEEKPGRLRLSFAALGALATGLLVTAALALTSLAVYNHNERRLLNLRVRELALVLAATAPSIQTPLASAAELADATGGNPQKFRAFMATYVGAGREFVSASLWPLGGSHAAPIAALGPAPTLASLPAGARAFFSSGTPQGVMNVTATLQSPHPSVGFEFNAPGRGRRYVVYAENPVPTNRRSKLERNSAFSDLDYALYLGRTQRSEDVLVTSEKRLPITGRQASATVPFGAATFTLVVTPRGSLGGGFFSSLPWIIAGVGVAITLAAAFLTERLARRRQRAERLAGLLDQVAADRERMYTEQRSISQTLQHALLPERLPEPPGLQVGARYVPAAGGVDIGGDWYDIVEVDERRVLLIIGDVSGHGLRAATTMAMLRHAALAYVAQDAAPASVLAKLSDFVNSRSHDYFATVLCALIDVDSHSVTLASAGHLAPLVLDDGKADFAKLDVDPPIGLGLRSHFREATMSVAPKAMVVAFTDGLVERRGEVIDVGLTRLRDAAVTPPLVLEELLARITRDLTSDERHDDTAIVGIQWQS
jgi:serine phosphatase RsbU (regulator of sigma subunit)